MEELTKKASLGNEAVKQKSPMLTAQIVWAAHVWNASAEEAAQQVVTDLLDHLSQGGSVTVHVAEPGGKEQTLEVTAG